MKTIAEIVKEINEAEITTSPAWIEDFVDIEGSERVATIDLDEHRWYWIGTVVYKLGGGYFGVRGVTSLKSEDMAVSDVGIKCQAFEVEAVPSVTYLEKEGEK